MRSPAASSLSPIRASARLSRALYRRLATTLAAHSAAASHSAERHPDRSATRASVLKVNRVPSRLTVSATPNESASSFPRNQRERIALWATTRGSDPMPKMRRPKYIHPMLGAHATITAPAVTSNENSRLARRVPIRSIKSPPPRTAKIAAKLYMLYIAPIAARSAPSASMSEGPIAPTLS